MNSIIDSLKTASHNAHGKSGYETARRAADLILNHTAVTIANSSARFKIAELEFYLHSATHPDPFVHCHPAQSTFGKWYLHRSGKHLTSGFKSGSFKGIDITFGNPVEPTIYGGVLIRSLESDDGEFINGSCLCVERLMQEAGVADLKSFHDSLWDRNVWDNGNALHIVDDKNDQSLPVFSSARVGLSLKKVTPNQRPVAFLLSRYRFLTEPRRVKKGRVNLILSMLRDGANSEQIKSTTGTNLKTIARYEQLVQSGLELDPSSLMGCAIGTEELCKLSGLADQSED